MKDYQQGYDESLGFGLRRVISVKDFMIRSDPIRVLTEAHEVWIECLIKEQLAFDDESHCFEESPLTTEEVKICCSDLRLLNKGDFKMLLKWRLQMLKEKKEEVKEMKKKAAEEEGKEFVDEEEEKMKEEEKEEEEEKDVSQQLQEVREKVAVWNEREKNDKQMEKRRAERKERKRLAKERKRHLLGLDKTPVASLGEPVFSLQDIDLIHVRNRIKNDDQQNEEIGDVNLNEVENPLNYLEEENDEESESEDTSDVDEMELLTSQLDSLYSQYQTKREVNEKRYLEELEKKKGLPAQKQRELVRN